MRLALVAPLEECVEGIERINIELSLRNKLKLVDELEAMVRARVAEKNQKSAALARDLIAHD